MGGRRPRSDPRCGTIGRCLMLVIHTHGGTAMTMGALIATWAKLGAVGAIMAAGVANAAEIKVIGSPGTREPYTLLLPGFEKATGHKVTTTWGGVNAVAKLVADGEVADIVMLPAAQ